MDGWMDGKLVNTLPYSFKNSGGPIPSGLFEARTAITGRGGLRLLFSCRLEKLLLLALIILGVLFLVGHGLVTTEAVGHLGRLDRLQRVQERLFSSLLFLLPLLGVGCLLSLVRLDGLFLLDLLDVVFFLGVLVSRLFGFGLLLLSTGVRLGFVLLRIFSLFWGVNT